MENYYLRVEAVNFTYFIYDTDKIQPMRGGSYLLLESVASLAGQKINGIELKKIMAGASIGLFSFKIADGNKAGDIVAGVRKILSDKTGGHATFVVDVLKSINNFERDNETITAMNRWQQFQQPTLVLPQKEAENKCSYDGVRPGETSVPTAEGVKEVSSSVKFRMDEGKKELKKRIYQRILKDGEFKEEFTDDLGALSCISDKGNLNNKMAFIYFDGNKFSKIRANKCTKEETLAAFSERVEERRKEFLCELIKKAQAEPDFKNNDAIRLETLLWGGDEFEIVVPAWKGWDVLRLFYKCMSNAEFDGVNLTHAGGVIFSNHKAPIRQIRNMARKLADMAKDKLPPDFKSLNHNKHDIALYIIMESFDTVGPDVKDFVRRYYGDGCYDDFYLTSDRMDNINEALSLMKKNGFPRNKIFEIIRIIKGNLPQQNDKIDTVLIKALSEVEEQDKVCAAIEKVIEGNYHRWLMIADLWDYAGREHA
ncbi:MAG: hypothetical protein HY756_08020 [Nitrospirae bacterium]|nr:hypothetical protein [Nitrospirota bacterium]